MLATSRMVAVMDGSENPLSRTCGRDAMGRAAKIVHHRCRHSHDGALHVQTCRSEQVSRRTLIVVIELSQSSWLAAARAPGVARDPLKKLKPDPEQLFKLIDRWREESRRAGRVVRRVCVAFEAGRDGFW